jgi:calcium/calmodulin-dependent protein kinase I
MDKIRERLSRFLTKDHVDKYYELKEDLGSGNFSVVKLGVNRKTGEEVAVKVIDKKRVGQKKEMIQTEVEILQRVHSPYIIQLKEMFETSTHLYLVMELVSGGELFDRIVEKGSYSERDAVRVMRQLFEGITYLHSLGIAHRDLKPENLLLATPSPDSDIKIADFGLSKIMGPEAHMKLTPACGTPGYVAPEVLTCEGYGKSVDLWSAGVIMYILLCGFPPFYEENNALLFEKIMQGRYSFPAPYWTNISQAGKDLVVRLLTVDCTKRINAETALKHPWITGEGVGDAPVDKQTLQKMREYNVSRKNVIRPTMPLEAITSPITGSV